MAQYPIIVISLHRDHDGAHGARAFDVHLDRTKRIAEWRSCWAGKAVLQTRIDEVLQARFDRPVLVDFMSRYLRHYPADSVELYCGAAQIQRTPREGIVTMPQKSPL
jgi:hypothetical protein